MVDDRRIDAALRDVRPPTGLAERVVAEALFDDAGIDRLLAQVAVPAGLVERMRSAVPAAGGRAEVTPAEAAASAPTASGRWRSRGAVAVPGVGLAVAACLAAVLLTSHGGPRWAGRPTWPQPVVIDPPGDAADLAAATGAGDPLIAIGMAAEEQPPTFAEPDDHLVAADPVADAAFDAADVPNLAAREEPTRTDVRGAYPGGIGGRLGGLETGMRVVPEPRSAARRIVPRGPHVDLDFEMTHGESPFVTPSTPAADRPPLTMGTDSFDTLRGWAGRRPPTEVVAGLRTEEVLAALPVPAPARDAVPGPAVAIHAVRSLRSRPATCLVEVDVTAGSLRRPAAAVDALLVIDPASGSEPLLWPRICRALTAVANLMRGDDRLSVVVGGPRPRLAGDRLDAAGIRRLAASLAAEPAVATADFDATMRAANREHERLGGRPLIVIAHAESVERARDEGRVAVAQWRESLAASGSGTTQPATRFLIVAPLERAVPGSSATAAVPAVADGQRIARELVERVFGVAGLTARQCRLEVSFDPKLVAGYRLVGHRQSAMESLDSAAPPAIDLHAGEMVRVVYEVIPRAADGRAVTAKLSFRPLDAAADRAVTATLSLKAVEAAPLPSPRGCELLLAVALGDIASGSPHAGPRSAAIQSVADLAAAWRARGDVSPGGATLLDAWDRLGFTPAAKPGGSPRPSAGGDRGRARLTD